VDSTFEPSPLADVARQPAGDRWTLVFVRELRHPPEKVWRALTEPAQLRVWAPFVPDRELTTTGPAGLTMLDGDAESPDGPQPGEVRRAEPPRLLEYTWADDVLQWELTPVDGGTRLTLRHTVESDEWLPRVASGWHLCLDAAERMLAGEDVAPVVGHAAMDHGWQPLHDGYAHRLGVTVSAADDGDGTVNPS
jgi:uncharacterized protein YndB with AHSA1/START domain